MSTQKTLIEKPICFVIMPIGAMDGYVKDHFSIVFNYIIRPACTKVGFEPKIANETKGSNVIILDVLKSIIESEMAICDISGHNPNVFYELGLRQAFNKPVTIIKDKQTMNVFDINTIRYVEYDSSLMVKEVESAVEAIAESLLETYKERELNKNSLLQALQLAPASITHKIKVDEINTIILNRLETITKQILDLRLRIPDITAESLRKEFDIMSHKINRLAENENVKNSVQTLGDFRIGQEIIDAVSKMIAQGKIQPGKENEENS